MSAHEFAGYMKALNERSRLAADPCPSETELIAYHAGRLASDQSDEVQAHLVRCSACRAVLADVAAFVDVSRPGEPEPDVEREWKEFQRRIPQSRTTTRSHRFSWLISPQLAWGVAASLMIVAGLSTSWAWRVQRNSGSKLAALEQRLLAESRRERIMAAQLARPEVSPAVYDLFPPDAITRAPEAAKPAPEVATDRAAVLFLNASGQPVFPAYSAEILNERGEVLWRTEALERSNQGTYVLVLPVGFLGPGRYNIRVYGKAREGYEKITEYPLRSQEPVRVKPDQK